MGKRSIFRPPPPPKKKKKKGLPIVKFGIVQKSMSFSSFTCETNESICQGTAADFVHKCQSGFHSGNWKNEKKKWNYLGNFTLLKIFFLKKSILWTLWIHVWICLYRKVSRRLLATKVHFSKVVHHFSKFYQTINLFFLIAWKNKKEKNVKNDSAELKLQSVSAECRFKLDKI